MLPALQNSGWAKWGSARADRILQSRALEKNGISFAGICKSPDVNSCPRFLLFPSAAPVGCDLRDLGSPSLQRNLQKRCHRILNMHRNLLSRLLYLSLPVFSPPQNFSLGIWDLLSARSSIGTSEALGSLAVRGTPCPHGLRPMRCKICCGCEHGRLRGQCKECGGSSSFCEHGRQRYYCNCKECGGSSFCEHRRQRSQCKECGRSSFCEHGSPREHCKCRVRWQQYL